MAHWRTAGHPKGLPGRKLGCGEPGDYDVCDRCESVPVRVGRGHRGTCLDERPALPVSCIFEKRQTPIPARESNSRLSVSRALTRGAAEPT